METVLLWKYGLFQTQIIILYNIGTKATKETQCMWSLNCFYIAKRTTDWNFKNFSYITKAPAYGHTTCVRSPGGLTLSYCTTVTLYLCTEEESYIGLPVFVTSTTFLELKKEILTRVGLMNLRPPEKYRYSTNYKLSELYFGGLPIVSISFDCRNIGVTHKFMIQPAFKTVIVKFSKILQPQTWISAIFLVHTKELC